MTFIMMVMKMRIRVCPVEKLGSITNDSYKSWEQHTVVSATAKLG